MSTKVSSRLSVMLATAMLVFCFGALNAYAATEFTSTIKTTGGDYSSLSAWQASNQCDLTAAGTKVYSGAKTGTVDALSVTLYRGGSAQDLSGTVAHATATQILVKGITGTATAQANDLWRVDASNYFTISNSGDSAIAVAQCYNDLSENFTVSGWTANSANYAKITISGISLLNLNGSLTLDGAGVYLALAGNIQVTGVTLQNSATLSILNNITAKVSGDWDTSAGTFTANQSTVEFIVGATGTSSISGNNTFYNLTCNSGKTLKFAAGSIQTITGAFTLDGPVLRSTTDSSPYIINATGTVSVKNVDIKDCTATTSFTAYQSKDSGGNSNTTITFNTTGYTRTWSGGTSTVWELDANWSDSGTLHYPGFSDTGSRVVIDKNAGNMPVITSACTIASLDLGQTYASTLTFYSLNTLTVTGNVNIYANGRITHTAGPHNPPALYKVTLSVGGNMTIASGGAIDVSSRGYYGNGPGSGGGSGYGGQGGNANATAGRTYGSITQPIDPGCGNGDGSPGGVIKLNITGTLTNNGVIYAYAAPTTYGSSGGSIWITTHILAGTGAINANGGYASRLGGGGGGRIALYYTDKSSYTGTVSAYGYSGNDGIMSAAGTIYEKPTGGSDIITVDNNNQTATVWTPLFSYPNPQTVLHVGKIQAQHRGRVFVGANVSAGNYVTETNGLIAQWSDSDKLNATPTNWWIGATSTNWYDPTNWATGVAPASSSDVVTIEGCLDLPYSPSIQLDPAVPTVTVRALGVGASSTLTLNAILDSNNYRLITTGNACVAVGGTLTHTAWTSSATNRLNLEVDGDMNIMPYSYIDVSGKGYLDGGPGCGLVNNIGPGYGGQGTNVNTTYGRTYGSITQPIDLGSAANYSDSAGGGAIKLNISGTLTNNGYIYSNYRTIASGGSIWITTNTLSGTGAINANGANGGGSGVNSGGGGRIALYYTNKSSSYNCTVTAYGGSPGAGAGTIYEKTIGGSDIITVDNGSQTGVTVWTPLFNYPNPATVLHVGKIQAQHEGRIFVGANVTADAAENYKILDGYGAIAKWSDSDKLAVAPNNWWIGATSTNWYDPTNWATGVAPTSSDVVTIEVWPGIPYSPSIQIGSRATLNDIIISDSPVTVRALGVGASSTFTCSSTLDETKPDYHLITTGNACVAVGGVLTHAAYTSSATNRLNLDVGGNMNIMPNSYIDVSAKGPCGGPGSNGRGAYGGQGSSGTSTYGSITWPTDLGSGYGSCDSTRYGAGAIKLTVAGTFTNNGSISSVGAQYGSGGSIWITCNTLSGTTGVINAIGGADGSGGGRIALYYTNKNYGGTVSAHGNVDAYGNLAGAGTIYEKSSAMTNGILTIDNANLTGSTGTIRYTTISDLEAKSYTFDSIILQNKGQLRIGSDDSLVLASSGTFSNQDVNSTLTIDSGGVFTNNGTFTLATCTATSALANSGTFTNASGSNFQYIGTAADDAVSVFSSLTYQGLELNNFGTTFTADGDLSVGSNFKITNGTFNLNAKTLTIGANFTNLGTFTHSNGTVILNTTTTSAVTGTNTFYNLTCATAGKTINFDSAGIQTIANNLSLVGASPSSTLIIGATAAPTKAALKVNGSQSVTFVSASYSDASGAGGNQIVANYSTDSGNNLNWSFVSQIIWSGAGSTPYWSDAANWSPPTVPTPTSDVYFNATSAKNCSVDQAVTIANLTLADGYGSGIVTLSGTSGQDLTVTNTITLKDGKLTDNGRTVNFKNLAVDNEANRISSTGLWVETDSGTCANPNYNYIAALKITSGKTCTLTNGFIARKLILEDSSTITGARQFTMYATANDPVVQGTGAVISVANLAFAPTLNITQGALNASATLTYVIWTAKTLTMTGNWNVADLVLYGTNTTTPQTLDTNGYNLTLNGTLQVGSNQTGSPGQYSGKIFFRNGTHTITGKLYSNGEWTHGWIDLGSSTVNLGGDLDLRYCSLTPGTGTINFTGTGTSKLYAVLDYTYKDATLDNPVLNTIPLYNLTSTAAGKTLQVEAGKTLTIAGNMTLQGTYGNLNFQSTTTGTGSPTTAYLNVSGTATNNKYLTVSDSDASPSSSPINAAASSGTRTANWVFSSFDILTPVLDEVLVGGTDSSITWDLMPALSGQNIRIQYRPDALTAWADINSGNYSRANDGSENWQTPGIKASAAQLRISLASDAGVYSDSATFRIKAGKVTLISPNAAGISWQVGAQKAITWQITGTVDNVKLSYSTDGGANWTAIIASTPAAAQLYNWTILAAAQSDNCKIKIEDATDSEVQAISGVSFKIKPDIIITYPNGGQNLVAGKKYTITWETRGTIDKLKFYYNIDDGAWVDMYAFNEIPNTGSEDWTIPAAAVSNNCKIKIVSLADEAVSKVCAAPFVVLPASLTITSPLAGEILVKGDSKIITWITNGTINNNLNIEYSAAGDFSDTVVIATGQNNAPYTWTIGNNLTASTTARIRVKDMDWLDLGKNVAGVSDAFEVSLPRIDVAKPDAAARLIVGGSYTVQWTSRGTTVGSGVKITYSPKGDFSDETVITNYIPNNGSFLWQNIPDTICATAKLRICDVSNESVFGVSASNFTITGALSLTSPAAQASFFVTKTASIAWSTTGSIVSAKLSYSANGKGSGAVWYNMSGKRVGDAGYAPTLVANSTGAYTWTVPDLVPASHAPNTNVYIKVEDPNDSLVFDLRQIAVSYYPVKWKVVDAQGLVGDLSGLIIETTEVLSGATFERLSGLTSPTILYYYPDRQYSSLWSRDAYLATGVSNWQAIDDEKVQLSDGSVINTNTAPLLVKMPQQLVTKALTVQGEYYYDAASDTLTVSAWLMQQDQMIPMNDPASKIDGVMSGYVDIFDALNNVVTTSDAANSAMLSPKGTFNAVWTGLRISGKLVSGQSYFARLRLMYESAYIWGNVSFQITGAVTMQSIQASLGVPTGSTLVGQIQSQLGLTGTETVAQKISEVKGQATTILTATQQTIPQQITQGAEQVTTSINKDIKPSVQSGILTRENAVKQGGTINIRYRTNTGLVPLLNVYSPKGIVLLGNKQMKEIGVTGVYEYAVTFTTAWGTGDFTVICSEPSQGTADALVITVGQTDIETVSSNVAAVLGNTSGIINLKNVTTTIGAQFGDMDKMLAQISKDVAARLEGAKGAVDELSTAFKQLESISKQVKEIGGTTGINLEKLYEVSKDKKGDITYLKNKAQELKAAMEISQKLIENVAQKPVVQTWFEFK